MSIFVKRMDQYQTISSLHIYLCVIFLSSFIIKIYKNVYIKLANFANLLNSQNQLSPEEELTEDMLSTIHSFSSRLYGLRKYEKIKVK